jgi:5-methylcytosine-specific restriction endonuclease McrA
MASEPKSDLAIKRERDRARQLRKSPWWQEKLRNPVCYYCSELVAPDLVTMDHVVPMAKGGLSTKNNLVVACKPCNNKKKNTNPVDFLLGK